MFARELAVIFMLVLTAQGTVFAQDKDDDTLKTDVMEAENLQPTEEQQKEAKDKAEAEAKILAAAAEEEDRIKKANELDAQVAAEEAAEVERKRKEAEEAAKNKPKEETLEEKVAKLQKTIEELEEKSKKKDSELKTVKKEFEDYKCTAENPFWGVYQSIQKSVDSNSQMVTQLLQQNQTQFNKWLDVTYQAMNRPSVPVQSPFDINYTTALRESFDSRMNAIMGNMGRYDFGQGRDFGNIYNGDVTYNFGNGLNLSGGPRGVVNFSDFGLNDQNSWRIPRTDLFNDNISPYASSAISFDQNFYRNPANFMQDPGTSWLNNSIRPYSHDFSGLSSPTP
ncbi:MAG: hypothetical protein JNM93_14080 [Bacteriovoracaceae bacterium]|nr:hypothetical protein [Bacteriovoracaceae bacterium]